MQYAFIGGLSISQALLVSPFITFTNRKYGLKVTMCIGLVLETAALLGASFASHVWQLFLSQGLCFGWGMGFLYGSQPIEVWRLVLQQLELDSVVWLTISARTLAFEALACPGHYGHWLCLSS